MREANNETNNRSNNENNFVKTMFLTMKKKRKEDGMTLSPNPALKMLRI